MSCACRLIGRLIRNSAAAAANRPQERKAQLAHAVAIPIARREPCPVAAPVVLSLAHHCVRDFLLNKPLSRDCLLSRRRYGREVFVVSGFREAARSGPPERSAPARGRRSRPHRRCRTGAWAALGRQLGLDRGRQGAEVARHPRAACRRGSTAARAGSRRSGTRTSPTGAAARWPSRRKAGAGCRSRRPSTNCGALDVLPGVEAAVAAPGDAGGEAERPVLVLRIDQRGLHRHAEQIPLELACDLRGVDRVFAKGVVVHGDVADWAIQGDGEEILTGNARIGREDRFADDGVAIALLEDGDDGGSAGRKARERIRWPRPPSGPT